jgi:hypothetical protein
VTVGQNLQHQQNPSSLTLAVIVLKARRSTYPTPKLLMPRVLELLENIKPGEVFVVS